MTKLKSKLIMTGSQFPPLVFICRSCGSPEVVLKWVSNEEPLRCRCLDCKEEWLEGRES